VSSIFRLAKHEHIVGYKDTSGSFVDHLSCIDHFRGTDFSVLQGMTQLSGPSMLMGADGCVPGIAPAFPELCVRLYEFAKNQETEKVREYSYLLLEAQSACTVARNTMSSAKFLNSLLGFMSERMCLPSEALSPEQKEFLTRKRMRSRRDGRPWDIEPPGHHRRNKRRMKNEGERKQKTHGGMARTVHRRTGISWRDHAGYVRVPGDQNLSAESPPG
jgi:hypothetical protein